MGSYLSTGPPYCHKSLVLALTNNLNLYKPWAVLEGQVQTIGSLASGVPGFQNVFRTAAAGKNFRTGGKSVPGK
jgi:hypothetical protein